jgi:N-acetylmuramoyl-L-alanine amidase
MKIALDPGHGGIFSGAIGTVPFELHEKDVVWNICSKLAVLLKKSGHQVVLTRNGDANLDKNMHRDLQKRAELINRANPNVLISVHCNAFSDPHPEGFEYWHRPDSQPAEALARALQQSLAKTFSDHLNRGIKPKDLALFRLTQAPACHIETEFITNPTQLEFLASDFNQEKIAYAIAQALQQFSS